MNSDTRVGIDGRRYARSKHKPYIDVLHLPISEAVLQASKMLRAGLLHAMKSSVPGDPRAPDPRAKPKPDSTAAPPAPPQPPRARAQSIYAAIVAQSGRNAKEKAAAAREVKEVPAQQPAPANRPAAPPAASAAAAAAAAPPPDRASSAAAPSAPPRGAKSWSSAARAGPSILSKRPRAAAAAASAASAAAASAAVPAAAASAYVVEKSGGPRPAPTPRVLPKGARARQIAARAPPPADPRRAAKKSAPAPAPASAPAAADPRRPGKKPRLATSAPTPPAPQTRPKPAPGTAAASGRALTVVASGKAAPGKTAPTMASVAARLAASGGSGGGAASGTVTVVAAGKKKALSAIAERFAANAARQQAAAAATTAAASAGLTALKPLLPRTIGAVAAARRAGPTVRYVKELKAIGNVPANGYLEIAPDKVRPVVTHDPRPKVPHKLRQTTIEKVFEALCDVRKLPMREALVIALRTEQRMYAQCATRVDYRAAAIVTLTDAKKV